MNKAGYVLVTGGAGYIGSHTVVELIQKGFTPVIVDDFRNSNPSVLKGIENITSTYPITRELDITNKAAFEDVFKEFPIHGVIHFAAYKSVSESVKKPLMYFRNNIDGLLNCLELAEKYNVLNFVFSSSCTVYGEPEGAAVVTEETPTQEASSPYGATKQMCERIISDLNKSGSPIRFLNLRYFNPVGAHPSGDIGELPIGTPNNLLPFVTQTAAGIQKELVVFGDDYNTPDGTCIRDYIHVVDLAKAHIHGLEWLDAQSNKLLETVNVGTGIGVSVLEIIHTFEDVSGTKLNWRFGNRRKGDIEQIRAGVDKAEKLMGWKSLYSIKDALTDAWNWEKNLRNG